MFDQSFESTSLTYRLTLFLMSKRVPMCPDWNESFDVNVKDSSVVTVQIFDQKKFKKKDQGFLGVINIPIANTLDLDLGGDGEHVPFDETCARTETVCSLSRCRHSHS